MALVVYWLVLWFIEAADDETGMTKENREMSPGELL